MEKESSPTIHLKFEVDIFDLLLPHIALNLSAEEAMEFIRQLDSKKEDWGFSEMIIAYGKELQTLRATERETQVYDYWVQTADGRDIKGQKEATSVNALVTNLKRQGFIVFNIETADSNDH